MFLGIITIDASESYHYAKQISELVDLLQKAVKKGLLKMVDTGKNLKSADEVKLPEEKKPINTDLNSEIKKTEVNETYKPKRNIIKRRHSYPSDTRAEDETPQKHKSIYLNENEKYFKNLQIQRHNKSIYLNKNSFIYLEQKWLGGSIPEIIDGPMNIEINLKLNDNVFINPSVFEK